MDHHRLSTRPPLARPWQPAPLLLSLLVLGGALASCSAGAIQDDVQPAEDSARAAVADEVLAAMDRQADPCQDFYRYACGGWLDATEIPGDRSRWIRSFDTIRERNEEALRAILEEPVSRDDGGQQARLFYQSCMHEEAIEEAGITPLAPLLQSIDRIRELRGLMRTAGQLQSLYIDPFFRFSVGEDPENPDVVIAHLRQGGLGLPDRRYYLEGGERYEALRSQYQGLIETILSRANPSLDADEVSKRAQAIFAFEKKLAATHLPRAELRDPEANTNKFAAEALGDRVGKGLPWGYFMQGSLGRNLPTEVNVQRPERLDQVAALLQGTSIEVLRDYLRWQLLLAAAPHLPDPFARPHFAFFEREVRGQQERRPLWKRCVEATDRALGEQLGALFVERRFAGGSRAQAEEIVENVVAAFERNLGGLDWMNPEARKAARGKTETLLDKIGYPDRWRDYGPLTVRPDAHVNNVLAARRFDFTRRTARLGQAPDRQEWYMSPPTVNAYYRASANEIVFPAGILQPPFFHRGYPAAMNYGGVGFVVGHEITHGFDDSGRKFDATGRLRPWWPDPVARAFEERAACVEAAYGRYEPQPGHRIDGKLTLGENIADMGGVKLAHQAYMSLPADERRADGAVVPDLTGEQLFFVAFAQTWCTETRPEDERLRLTTDPHAPPRFRVNGPLSQLPAFGRAFSCPAGSPMRPSEGVCSVW